LSFSSNAIQVLDHAPIAFGRPSGAFHSGAAAHGTGKTDSDFSLAWPGKSDSPDRTPAGLHSPMTAKLSSLLLS